MKKYLVSIFLLLNGILLIAQQEPQYTHYAYKRLAYNPAVAGSIGNGVVGLLYRNQWSGIDGAPKTAILSAHMPFFRNRCGIGMTLVHDKVGISTSSYATLAYAYRIPLNNSTTLSMGLQGEVEYSTLNWQNAILNSNQDQLAGTQAANTVKGNAGAGIYVHHQNWYIGLSVPRLFKNSLYKNINSLQDSKRDYRSYFASGGIRLPLSTQLDFVPMAMVSFGPSIPTTVDLGANFVIMKRLGLGANWRVMDSFSGLVMLQLNNQFRTGFAYDFTTSPLKKATSGSWEIMLEYQFKCNDKDLVNSIRYF